MSLLADIKRVWNNLLNIDEWSNADLRNRMEAHALRRDYYDGYQRQQLTVKNNQPNDNIALNFCGLVVERSVSMLLGQGIEFDLPGEPEEREGPDGKIERVDQPNQAYINEVWQANRKDILLHKVAQFGGIHGTNYIKMLPDATESRENEGKMLPRLVVLDPLYMSIETDADDIDTVIRYKNRYNIKLNGLETARREIIERVHEAITDDDGVIISNGETSGWTIINEYSNQATSGKWAKLYPDQTWPYEFPPIIHWQNLPNAGDVYGRPDVSNDVMALQDRINFIASNVSKIIRYHAHPKTWGRMFGSSNNQSWGADEMVIGQSEHSHLQNLEMQSDLDSSQKYLLLLRQALFDITRTVDITSLADRLGALTNFGLRVLFLDATMKLATKQELYGEALTELNHRLLAMDGQPDTDGGRVVWPDILPSDGVELIAELKFDVENGLASKETIANTRGYNWTTEQERIAKEVENERLTKGNIGSTLLAEFFKGGGAEETGG
jgi:hypothetical protein